MLAVGVVVMLVAAACGEDAPPVTPTPTVEAAAVSPTARAGHTDRARDRRADGNCHRDDRAHGDRNAESEPNRNAGAHADPQSKPHRHPDSNSHA